jgi:ribonucleoside-diphosphate reductase beta chain
LYYLDRWTERCIPSVLGYSADLHKSHSRYLADKRLSALGYEKIWRTSEALPWLDEMASIKKEKNFFETRVTEYQSSSSLKFDDIEDMDALANWR